MNEQQLFSDRMSGLMDLATDKGGLLSKGEIHFYLKDIMQSEDQYEFVYQFLAEKGVRVEGWRGKQSEEAKKTVAGGTDGAEETEEIEKTGETEETGETTEPTLGSSNYGNYENIEDFTGLLGTRDATDSREEFENYGENAGEMNETVNSADDADDIEFDAEDSSPDADDLPLPSNIDESLFTADEKRYLRYYQADLADIEPMTDQERNSLLNALAAGDPSAMNRLAEGHLYLVMEEIAAYLHAGVPVSDLIQEASIGLLEGIQSYRGLNFEAHVRYAIREALDAITEEQQASDSVAKHLLDSISRMDEATRKLSEELDRTPTKEELAEYLHMDVDEVEIILKHSIDALTVSVSDEAYGKTEDESE